MQEKAAASGEEVRALKEQIQYLHGENKSLKRKADQYKAKKDGFKYAKTSTESKLADPSVSSSSLKSGSKLFSDVKKKVQFANTTTANIKPSAVTFDSDDDEKSGDGGTAAAASYAKYLKKQKKK